jgi:hypothetical protein
MNFGQAIEALKEGKKIARKNWNGKNMYLYLNKGLVDPRSLIDQVSGDLIPEENLGDISGIKMSLFNGGSLGMTTRLPNINMITANDELVMGWLASQTDILAEDWYII